MRFKLGEDNKILMYGPQIFEGFEDRRIESDQIALLNKHFSIDECFLIDNKVVVGNPLDLSIPEIDQLAQKRDERKSLLEAFDKWEKAVLRGRQEDSFTIMSWYYSLLNLEDEAFIEIPDEIKYYLTGRWY